MTATDDDFEDDHATLADAHSWLQSEIEHSTKALELRLREAGEIVHLYARGEIKPHELSVRQNKYYSRWGDALPFGKSTEGIRNDEIVSAVDEAREDYRRIVGASRSR